VKFSYYATDISPHLSQAVIDADYCYRPGNVAWSVCLLVKTVILLATSGPFEIPFRERKTCVSQRNRALYVDGGPVSPNGKACFRWDTFNYVTICNSNVTISLLPAIKILITLNAYR